jgi:hypothetical protein
MIDAILSEARAAVAAGRDPDWKSLRDRLRAAGLGAKELKEAMARLERIGAVQRARRSAAPPPPTPAPAPKPALLRTKPTITGNMDVRRAREHVLAWTPLPAVESWEVRISERPDLRSDYAVREERSLPGAVSELELSLGDTPTRVHLLGRSRSGKLVQRATVSGLTSHSCATHSRVASRM